MAQMHIFGITNSLVGIIGENNENLSLLGSTGSIGRQTLDVARNLGLTVCALAAHSSVKELENQIREFKPQLVAVFDLEAAKQLKLRVADLDVKVVQGMEGLCEAASFKEADLVLNSVVGMVGLKPTLAAIEARKDLALANKETLVAGGRLVMDAAARNQVKILPVDSEHSAIFQCLQGCPEQKALKRIILTASGGPFFGRTKEELRGITPQQALKHPNWNMGAKITVDSATMMNKGLEIMEASWLFGLPPERIDVVVHRESVIHSMIEYQDSFGHCSDGRAGYADPHPVCGHLPADGSPRPSNQLEPHPRAASLSFCCAGRGNFCLPKARSKSGD